MDKKQQQTDPTLQSLVAFTSIVFIMNQIWMVKTTIY